MIIITMKKIIVFLLMLWIALTQSATYMEKYKIRPGKPRLCIAGQYVLHEGQRYKDNIHCRYYMCSKGRMPDELILYVNSCGTIHPPENCHLERLPRETPYPKCCQRKIVCKN